MKMRYVLIALSAALSVVVGACRDDDTSGTATTDSTGESLETSAPAEVISIIDLDEVELWHVNSRIDSPTLLRTANWASVASPPPRPEERWRRTVASPSSTDVDPDGALVVGELDGDAVTLSVLDTATGGNVTSATVPSPMSAVPGADDQMETAHIRLHASPDSEVTRWVVIQHDPDRNAAVSILDDDFGVLATHWTANRPNVLFTDQSMLLATNERVIGIALESGDVLFETEDLHILGWHDDVLLAQDVEDGLSRIDPLTGEPVWNADARAGWSIDGVLVAIDSDSMYRLDPDDGNVMWETTVGWVRWLPVPAGDGRIAFQTGDAVVGLSADDGTELWRHDIHGTSTGSAAEISAFRVDDEVYVWTGDEAAKDGRVSYGETLYRGSDGAHVSLDDDIALPLGCDYETDDSKLNCTAGDDIVWSFELGETFHMVAEFDDVVIVRAGSDLVAIG